MYSHAAANTNQAAGQSIIYLSCTADRLLFEAKSTLFSQVTIPNKVTGLMVYFTARCICNGRLAGPIRPFQSVESFRLHRIRVRKQPARHESVRMYLMAIDGQRGTGKSVSAFYIRNSPIRKREREYLTEEELCLSSFDGKKPQGELFMAV